MTDHDPINEPVLSDPDGRRLIEIEVEVDGTPEEVWEAIATGPGISSWYVPHTVEEVEGGAMAASFGPGMDVAGVVQAWEPPGRVLFGGEGDGPGLAFEWLVEAKDGGSCVVRLVNTGFGDGEEWDSQYDAMREGWRIFMANLALHCRHFRGETARPSLPMSYATGSAERAWAALTERLGLTADTPVGHALTMQAPDGTNLEAVVEARGDHHLLMTVTAPVRGTAFASAEAVGEVVGTSMWTYLYGDEGATFTEANEAGWQALLAELS